MAPLIVRRGPALLLPPWPLLGPDVGSGDGSVIVEAAVPEPTTIAVPEGRSETRVPETVMAGPPAVRDTEPIART